MRTAPRRGWPPARSRPVVAIGARREPEEVFIGGSSRIAASFDAVETVRSVLAILEQQLVVVDLLHDVLARGLSVAIGEEHGYEPLSSARSSWRRSPSRARRAGWSGSSGRRG